MKGDFSRLTFIEKKHYSAVLMQQGRVQVDADWNEQQAINRHRVETEARDVIGPCGVPQSGGGFKIASTPDGSDLFISSGRIYVDGILGELEAETPVSITFPAGSKNQATVETLKVDDREFQPGQWVELFGEDKKDKKRIQITAQIASVNTVLSVLKFDTDISQLHNTLAPQLRRLDTYIFQPDYPDPPYTSPSGKWPKLNLDAEPYVVYLDVWQRHMTALDDPHIREKALDGPDTATRSKTVWQVKFLPIHLFKYHLEDIRSLFAEMIAGLQKLVEASEKPASIKRTRAMMKEFGKIAEAPDEKLLKEMQSDPQWLRQFLKKPEGELEKIDVREDILTAARNIFGKLVQKAEDIPRGISCGSKLSEWENLLPTSTGTLNARTQKKGGEEKPCLIPPSAGYQRLENQLYRVEIHQSGPLGKATFKWSRDNGSVVAAIKAISGTKVTLSDVGPDEILGFASGQWVEIADDATELKLNHQPGYQPGPLVRIIDDKEKPVLEVTTMPTWVDPSRHAKSRRWDSPGEITVEVPADNDGWIPLEGGIEVKFSDGTYKTGDYWLIPARTATSDIEWRAHEFPQKIPIPQRPMGIWYLLCPLGIVQKKTGQKTLTVQDCRKVFPALTEGPPAIHVIGTNWLNDEIYTSEQFPKDGLKITLDAEPNLDSVNSATLIVTVEAPVGKEGNVPSISWIVDGEITINSNVIQWRPKSNIQFEKLWEVQPLIRARVTLKGHTIWSDSDDQWLYLDGQAFGQPALRADQKPRTALIFPSGDRARASDFESWFYLTKGLPLQIKTVKFYSVSGSLSSAGIINLPPIPQNVHFKAAENINTIEIVFNRAVLPDGLGVVGTPQSLIVERQNPNGAWIKASGTIQVDNKVVRFIAGEPKAFGPMPHRLTILGDDTGNLKAVKAKDDGSPLDGNYDGQPGGDFIFPFHAE